VAFDLESRGQSDSCCNQDIECAIPEPECDPRIESELAISQHLFQTAVGGASNLPMSRKLKGSAKRKGNAVANFI
jgi:hypothetical protein